MVIDERARHALFQKLEDAIGLEDASTLMEHLPPVGWADVATKSDIQALEQATKRDIQALEQVTKSDIKALEQRMEQRMDSFEERVDHRFDSMEIKFEKKLLSTENKLLEAFVRQNRTLFLSMMGTTATVSSLAFAIAKLV